MVRAVGLLCQGHEEDGSGSTAKKKVKLAIWRKLAPGNGMDSQQDEEQSSCLLMVPLLEKKQEWQLWRSDLAASCGLVTLERWFWFSLLALGTTAQGQCYGDVAMLHLHDGEAENPPNVVWGFEVHDE